MADTHNPQLCRGCATGDCYAHVAEFLDEKYRVRKCHCPDPHHAHGKLKKKENQ